MTNPFPTSFNNQLIQDPGLGGSIAQALAHVLAAQQAQQEQQYRLQQLAQQQQQQQALADYYKGTIGVQNREQDRLAAKQQADMGAQAQVGAAQRAALGGGTPMPAPQMAVPQAQQGNMTQGMQATPAAMPPGQPTTSQFQQILQGGAQAIGGEQGLAQIFGGVSDANMPAAVGGVQDVQKLMEQPKGPELPTSGKEFMFAQHLMQIDPSGKATKFFIDNWVNKPGTVINNIPSKVESAYGTELAKSDVAGQQIQVKAAQDAVSAFPSMSEAYKLVDKSFTGFGANQALGIARAANLTGWKPSKDRVADTQTLVKLLREGVIAQLQTRALGSGTAVSDADRVFMERQAGADITLNPETIKRIIRINVGTGIEKMVSAKMELEQAMVDHPESQKILQGKIKLINQQIKPIWEQYRKMLGQEAQNDATTMMNAGPAGNSLFPAR